MVRLQGFTDEEMGYLMPRDWEWEDKEQRGGLSVYGGKAQWSQVDVKWGLANWAIAVDYKTYLQQVAVEEGIKKQGGTPGRRLDYVGMTLNRMGPHVGKWNGALQQRTKVAGERDQAAYGLGNNPTASRHYNIKVWGIEDWDDLEGQLWDHLGGIPPLAGGERRRGR